MNQEEKPQPKTNPPNNPTPVLLGGSKSEIDTGDTAAKTLLVIEAPTHQRVLVWEWEIVFRGTISTDQPILCRLLRQSGGTFSEILNASIPKWDDTNDETIQTKVYHTQSADPTDGSVLWEGYVHPQTGYRWQAPVNEPYVVPGGGRLGIDVTASRGVEATVRMVCEE